MKKAITGYFRGIKRSKISFIINLVGLTGGLACTFLIYLWVRDEMSFDKFHANDSKLYQVMVWSKTSDGPKVGYDTPGPLADEMAKKIPGVDKAVAVINSLKTNTLSNNNKAFKADGIYAGKDFFRLFNFDLIDGKKESALNDLSNIVISEGLALKLFGTTNNIIGKSVEFDRNDRFVVSGVTKNTPANSSMQFDYVLPLNAFIKHGGSIRWGELNARKQQCKPSSG